MLSGKIRTTEERHTYIEESKRQKPHLCSEEKKNTKKGTRRRQSHGSQGGENLRLEIVPRDPPSPTR